MSDFNLKKIIAAVFIFILVAPSAFLIAPPRVHAWGIVYDPTNWIENTLNVAQNTISAASSPINTAADVAKEINSYVLQPLAFVLSGNILKSMTSSIIDFINGKTNGTGRPQFVQNLRGYLQGTSDAQALTFSSQFGKYSNSPYAAQIANSLRDNYLKNSTTRGFFTENKNTLSQASPNPTAFINGNFGEGNWKAWLSLTTNCQNDPYCLQDRAQRQLSSLVQTKTTAALNELSWNSGFLSWCGGTSSFASPSTTAAERETGTAPGDSCTKKDGSSGTILTPGSVIKDELQSVTNANITKNTHIGNLGPEVNSILGDMGSIMATVNLASNMLGGSGSGGLAGISQPPAGGGISALSQYATSTGGYLGASNGNIIKNNASFSTAVKDMLGRINKYGASWNTIGRSAGTASSALISLAASCSTQKIAANAALATEVAPIFSQAAAASSTIATAKKMVAKVQAETNTGSATGAYANDLYALTTMPPTNTDVVKASQNARSFGNANANPKGSLTISSGFLVDRMNLLTKNAELLLSTCATSTLP